MNPPWQYGDPRALAQAILAQPRFRSAAQTPGVRSWWDLLFDALRRLWDAVTAPLRQLRGGQQLADALAIVLLVVAIGALGYLIVRFARRARAARSARPALHTHALDAAQAAATLHDAALSAASAGRWREAAALLWTAELRALDELGRVRYDAARTPGEWRRLVGDPSFDAFARDAVVALFGDRSVDAALVERMRVAYERIVTT